MLCVYLKILGYRNMKLSRKFLSKDQKLVPGIYGGMGPYSHIFFETLLLDACKDRGLTSDQNHPVWLLVNGASTPDRTKSLMGGESSLEHLLYFSRYLESAGADFIVITCNTAHTYLPLLRSKVNIPIISLIEITGQYLKEHSQSLAPIGILATTGTIVSRLYQNYLNELGIKNIAPSSNSDVQKVVMDSIYNKKYGIKYSGTDISSQSIEQLKNAGNWIQDYGAQSIIAGCTETSIAFDKNKISNLPIIDPLKLCASKVIDCAFGKSLNFGRKKLLNAREASKTNSLETFIS